MSHDTLEKRIFPAKGTPASELVMPDLLHFDTEMRKPGVTRQLLWMEYKAQAGELAMGYSHFCRCYREWKKTRRLSMRQEHRAGEKLFIDLCGPTVPVVNPDKAGCHKRGHIKRRADPIPSTKDGPTPAHGPRVSVYGGDTYKRTNCSPGETAQLRDLG